MSIKGRYPSNWRDLNAVTFDEMRAGAGDERDSKRARTASLQEEQAHPTMAEQEKYDRQLRLWGIHGQRKLMSSHICLLNAGPTGTEALKNLVLPGIGQFTIVDANNVTEFDCENNFFVDETYIGKPRAKATRDLLVEVNPDVKGNAIVRDPREVIKNEGLAFFTKFTLVLATQLDEDHLSCLGDLCESLQIPLVIARTYGLIGHVRLYCSEHHVLELKPSPAPMQDLRVFNPFPALRELTDSVDLTTLDTFEYKHVPFIIILIKTLDAWKSSHDGKAPQNYLEKEAFKKSIKALARLPWGEEENLFEAVNNASQAFAPANVSPDVTEILNDSKIDAIDGNTPDFWILARALRDFCAENQGTLPLPGNLPDMTSTTSRYIQLQNCFSAKAKEDFARFSAKVDEALKLANRPLASISQEARTAFCVNSGDIVVIKSRTLRQELTSSQAAQEFEFEFGEVPAHMHPITWYILWRACDQLFVKTGSYPGQNPTANESELAKDASELLAKAKAIVDSQYKSSIPHNEALTEEVAMEMVRYGATEMHNVAALIGGIAAQECVKLLTQQYLPLNNTFLFNGIISFGKFFQL